MPIHSVQVRRQSPYVTIKYLCWIAEMEEREQPGLVVRRSWFLVTVLGDVFEEMQETDWREVGRMSNLESCEDLHFTPVTLRAPSHCAYHRRKRVLSYP